MRAEQVSAARSYRRQPSRRLSITRDAMMPGMAQAKLDSSGMKARRAAPRAHDAVHQNAPRHVAEVSEQDEQKEMMIWRQ